MATQSYNGQLFSFKNENAEAQIGTIKDYGVCLNLVPKSFVVSLGLARPSNDPSSFLRFHASRRTMAYDYSFTNGMASDPETPTFSTNVLQIKEFKQQKIITEYIDQQLFTKAGEIRGYIISKWYESWLLWMDFIWLKTAHNSFFIKGTKTGSDAEVLNVNKTENIAVIVEPVLSGNTGIKKALEFTDKVRSLIQKVAQQFDIYGDVDKSNLIGICSLEFTRVLAQCYASLGHNPEYVKQDGRQFLQVDGVKFVETKWLGQKLEIKKEVKDSSGVEKANDHIPVSLDASIDFSDYWFILIEQDAKFGSKPILNLYKGAYFWSLLSASYNGNKIDGFRVPSGINPWPLFKNRIGALVKKEIATVIK